MIKSWPRRLVEFSCFELSMIDSFYPLQVNIHPTKRFYQLLQYGVLAGLSPHLMRVENLSENLSESGD
jgi:hypothetical protein